MMRNHIVFKFLAVALCAAALLSAVAGGVGIFLMTESGLYEKNVDELYHEQLESYALNYAVNRWEMYASRELGGAGEDLAESFYQNWYRYNIFRPDRVGFTIRDGEGNAVLEDHLSEGVPAKYTYTFAADYSFLKVLSEEPYVEAPPTEATMPPEVHTTHIDDVYVYDAIPELGAEVYGFEIGFADGSSEGVFSEEPVGILRKSADGVVKMLPLEDNGSIEMAAYPVQIVFYGREQICLYQASNPEGVMDSAEYRRGVGQSILLRKLTEDAAVVETIPTVPIPVVTGPMYNEETDPSVAATEEVLVPEEKTGDIFHYYNNVAQQRMEVEYTLESVPGYTMTVELAAKPLQHEADWVLARTLYAYRNWLPALLGAGLLLFAITAVYLCCAAARKPKTDEVRPGGLNCIPLDLYLAMTGFGVVGLAFLAVEAIPEIMGELRVMLVVGGLLAYAASLLIVGFCFACAAQFKTKGGYWWRHTLCGLCLKLVEKICRLGFRLCRKLFPLVWRMVKAVFGFVILVLGKIFAWLKKVGKSLGKKLNRFYSLLPVTWQWMLVGFGVIIVLSIAIFNRRDGLIFLLGICAAFAVILYGAHCFGLLLESTKRMRKGNLEEKVDDKLMTGSFREFAGELNGLADVAVVAAQKQLKSERMKTELITNVSHDIKTPLTSIINYVDLLKKPHTQEEQEKYLEVLDRQSQRLKKLVEDLMEMSKASTGNLAVEITRVDAAEAVNQALGEFADKLEKAQLYPVFRQPEQPVYMLADGRLVWRVMSNLLSNTVKYALPGTRVYVDLQQLEDRVILSIKNISREALNIQAEELLERFVRGDVSRNTEGSGLGLNIAQSLMELQKGQLQILVDGDLFKVTLIFPAEE